MAKQDFLDIFKQIAPDLMDTVKERYLLLRHISDAEPVGRRTLAGLSGLSERVVRSHVEVLRQSGIVQFSQQGISLQPQGRAMLPDLLQCFVRFEHIDELQISLQQKLHLKQVLIVPGDCDRDKTAKEELGRQGALLLSGLLDNTLTVAISGGSTMAEVAHKLPESTAAITVVPARGGVGDQVEYQANVIAAAIAGKTGGVYHMLHIPDGLTERALRMLVQSEPQTRKIVMLARKADVILFGIGRADTMASKRHLDAKRQDELLQLGACGEALGYYCNLQGQVVSVTNNVGLSIRELAKNPHVVAVAGGASKAEAIVSVMRACHTGTLVTDEAAASRIDSII